MQSDFNRPPHPATVTKIEALLTLVMGAVLLWSWFDHRRLNTLEVQVQELTRINDLRTRSQAAIRASLSASGQVDTLPPRPPTFVPPAPRTLDTVLRFALEGNRSLEVIPLDGTERAICRQNQNPVHTVCDIRPTLVQPRQYERPRFRFHVNLAGQPLATRSGSRCYMAAGFIHADIPVFLAANGQQVGSVIVPVADGEECVFQLSEEDLSSPDPGNTLERHLAEWRETANLESQTPLTP
jgi:hypothetical protein